LKVEFNVQPSTFIVQRFLPVSPRLLQRPSQEELDLAVQAAQVVVCPALNGLEDLAVDPQEKGFAIRHGGY
jgi:hypothetical protein